jgi:hypothetical protein
MSPLGYANMMPSKPAPKRSAKQKRKRLVELMDTYKMTSDTVANVLEVHPVTVRRWKTQENIIPNAYLALLEAYCVGIN